MWITADVDDLIDVNSRTRLVAPALLDFEVTSVVRSFVLRGLLGAERAGDALADFDRLAISRWSSAGDLRRRTLDLRDNFSADDAAYVVLAEALECPLLTRDRRLARAAQHLIPVEVV